MGSPDGSWALGRQTRLYDRLHNSREEHCHLRFRMRASASVNRPRWQPIGARRWSGAVELHTDEEPVLLTLFAGMRVGATGAPDRHSTTDKADGSLMLMITR